jgi:glycine betaine/proline transport system permease protein
MATLAAPMVAFRRPSRGMAVVAVLAVWVVGWAVLKGQDTLALDQAEVTPLHQRINDVKASVDAGRNSNPLFLYVFNEIRLVIDNLVTFLSNLIAQPAFGRPVPLLGWLGVVAIATLIAWAVSNVRMALLTAAGLVFLGLQGLWVESMQTLALTLAAVFFSLLIGIPVGIWAGMSARFNTVITPVLDLMQIMPTYVYLSPLVLFFLIGPASAVIATLIYAAPPVIRITAHGIRSVPRSTVEASESLGSTRWQTLTKVMLPMARRTIVIGVNQTIMAALAMVTIASLIDAPGLGASVLRALTILDVGGAFNAGLSLVVLAIVLDRVTTAASERADVSQRQKPGAVRLRRMLLAAGVVPVAVCCYLAYTYQWAAVFPTTAGGHDITVGSTISTATDSATMWVQDTFSGLTTGFKNTFTTWVIDPVQSLLADSPWYLVAAVVVLLALIIGGTRAAVVSAVCLAVILGTGLWSDSMVTLAATLIATVLSVAMAIVIGVWMGRSRMVDRIIRPVLDAAQVMPAFVYLIPFFALFDVGRFTAIVAAVVYAAPVSIKLIADGIVGVAPTTVEAAESAGTNAWQMITKVQLPMARPALLLAINQGLIYVLSMVVIGGLVGAQALGYDVTAGFKQSSLFGKGLAAGVAIVTLGIMLDRITQAAARRAGPVTAPH